MTKYFDIIADYDKKIQSLIYKKGKEIVGECSRYSMNEENVQKFLENSLNKGIEIDSYKEREIKKHAKRIQRISARRVKKFNDEIQVKEIINRFSVILNEVKNEEFDVRLGILVIMCNYLYILKAKEKVNALKNIIYEKLILVYFQQEIHITECIYNYLWVLYTSQSNRANVPFKEEEKHIKNLYECYCSEKTQVIGLYLLAYEFKAYSNDLGEDIYNNRFKNMCEYKDSLDKIIKIVRGLDGDFLEFFFSEGHRYQIEIKNHNFKVDQRPPLPYVFFTSAADKLVELLPDNYLTTLDNTRFFLVEQIIDKREILSDENIDGLLYLVRNMRLFVKKKESVNCVVKYKADSFREKVQSPLVIYRTYASFLVFQILNRVIEEYQEVISLNEELKRQSDNKADFVNNYLHTTGNLNSFELQDIARLLLRDDDVKIRNAGRRLLAEANQKELLKEFARMLKWEFNNDIKKLEENVYGGMNYICGKKIDDILDEALKSCLLKIIYSCDSRDKDLRKKIEDSIIGCDFKRFCLDFEENVICSRRNCVDFLMDKGIVIQLNIIGKTWSNIFLEDSSRVFFIALFLELFVNYFKHGVLQKMLVIQLSETDKYIQIKMKNVIDKSNSYKIRSSRIGIEGQRRSIYVLNKENEYSTENIDGFFVTKISLLKKELNNVYE